MIKGKAWKFGDNINTDVIIPARYLTTSDPRELAKHVLEGVAPNFSKKVAKDDVLVAGENFGCGSSREHAAIAIKAIGISCIIAKSFARIFYRNAINIGLPILESREAVKGIKQGDRLEIDLAKGQIKNLRTGRIFKAQPFPEFMQKIIQAGGLINYVKRRFR